MIIHSFVLRNLESTNHARVRQVLKEVICKNSMGKMEDDPQENRVSFFGSKLEVANDSLCSKCVLKRISGKRGGKNV